MTFLNIKMLRNVMKGEKLKLKEFDFDYPYEKNEDYIQSLLDNGHEYLQATKKDYEKIIKQAESILECKQDVLLHLLKDWLKK